MILQQDQPDDFVLATGETHSVREFVEKAFAHAGITIQWKGDTGTVNEIGVDANDPEHVLVKIDPDYFRPTEVSITVAGWHADVAIDQIRGCFFLSLRWGSLKKKLREDPEATDWTSFVFV